MRSMKRFQKHHLMLSHGLHTRGLIMKPEEALVTSTLNSWKNWIERADKSFSPLTEDQLQKEVAPGKNRLIYLVGHLTAVHDRMLPLLDLGPRLHPELDTPFLSNPDRATGRAAERRRDQEILAGDQQQIARGI